MFCSVRTARDCCTSSPISIGPSCKIAPHRDRNCPHRPRLRVGWASFRVYRTTLLLLVVAAPAVLHNHGDMIRSQSSLYDDACFVVHLTDVLMRSEQFERLRRAGLRSPRGRRGHVKLRPCQAVADSVRDGRRGHRVVQRKPAKACHRLPYSRQVGGHSR